MIRANTKLFVALAPSVLLGLWGCGVYSFKSGGASVVESVAVLPIENRTVEAGVAERITELVTDALITDGTIKVTGPATAEAMLSGALISYQRDAFAFDENDQVKQYAVKLTVALTLTRKSSGEKLWEETFANQGVYDAVNESEADGQAKAAKLIVVDILAKTTKSW